MSRKKTNPNHILLSQFSGQDSFITTPKIYYQLTGCLNKAYVLNQIIFYTGKSTLLKNNWFFKSYEDWQLEVLLCERTLRSYFKEFVGEGWIDMRTIKIDGIRTPTFRANLDKIHASLLKLYESLNKQEDQELPQTANTSELVKDCPKRQILPESQTANIAVSTIYTDKDLQITTNCESSSSNFVFSETLDQNILNQKLERDDRSQKEFMDNVIAHVDNFSDKKFSRLVRAQGVLKILKIMKAEDRIFYASGMQPKQNEIPITRKQISKPAHNFTNLELEEISEYKHWEKSISKIIPFEKWLPNPEKRERILRLIEKEKEFIKCQQKENASQSSLKLDLSTVFHQIA